MIDVWLSALRRLFHTIMTLRQIRRRDNRRPLDPVGLSTGSSAFDPPSIEASPAHERLGSVTEPKNMTRVGDETKGLAGPGRCFSESRLLLALIWVRLLSAQSHYEVSGAHTHPRRTQLAVPNTTRPGIHR